MTKINLKHNTMKNSILGLLLVFSLLIVGCSDDFFTETPSDRISPDQHYNSEIDAEISCVAPLAILQEVVPQMVFASDLLSDITVPTDRTDSDWKDIFYHNFDVNNPHIDPSSLYKVIVNANEALLYIDDITKNDKDITEIEVNIYKGNLVGIRSWAYFNIARLYGEVAYVKDNLPEYSRDKIVYLQREEMFDTLVSHLTPYLDIDYIDYLNISMYNKALLGEVYLEQQNYESAAVHLQGAIEGFENLESLYKVDKSYSKLKWQNIFVSSADQITEVMVAVPFAFNDKQSNPIELWYGYDYEYQARPGNMVIDLFLQQDNQDRFRGYGVSFIKEDEKLVVNKYNLNRSLELSSDIVLYRAADIHLLLAEALNRTGSSDIALSILNEGYHEFLNWTSGLGVRGRVMLSPIVVPDGVNQVEYIEDKILEERVMELAFEGKRWFDLMRVARRRGASYLADKVAAKYGSGGTADRVREKLKNEENWYLPTVK